MTQSELLDHLKDIQSEIEDSDNSCEVRVQMSEGLNMFSPKYKGCSIKIISTKKTSSKISSFLNIIKGSPDFESIDKSTIQKCIRGIEYLFELEPDVKFILGRIFNKKVEDYFEDWESFQSKVDQFNNV